MCNQRLQPDRQVAAYYREGSASQYSKQGTGERYARGYLAKADGI